MKVQDALVLIRETSHLWVSVDGIGTEENSPQHALYLLPHSSPGLCVCVCVWRCGRGILSFIFAGQTRGGSDDFEAFT